MWSLSTLRAVQGCFKLLYSKVLVPFGQAAFCHCCYKIIDCMLNKWVPGLLPLPHLLNFFFFFFPIISAAPVCSSLTLNS